MINKYFPAANTPNGFVNFFSDAINEAEMNRVIYLKGGPGTGKSCFMKSIGQEAVRRGLELEQMFCSADSDSLDILKIPSLKTVILDATAPHNFDPVYPVVSGVTLNMAAFLKSESLAQNSKKIIELSDKKSAAFKLMYKYLKAAGDVIDGIDAIAASAINDKYIAHLAGELFLGFLEKQQPLPKRRAFADSLSEQGINNMFKDGCATGKVISIKSPFDLASAQLLRVLEKRLHGISTQKYYSIFNPQNLSHISVGNVDIVTHFNGIADYTFDLTEAFDSSRLKLFEEDLKHLSDIVDLLLKQARIQLAKAKSYHKEIEVFYIAAMDFDEVNNALLETKNKIFADN